MLLHTSFMSHFLPVALQWLARLLPPDTMLLLATASMTALASVMFLELQVTDPVDELAGVVLCLKSEILSSGADPQYKCITNNNSQISSNFLLLLPCFPSSNCSNMIITRLVLEIP